MIDLEYQHIQQEETVSSLVGSSPTDNETGNIKSTQTETKEKIMDKKSFKLNLKSKWVVGLVVSLTLGLGEVHTRSYVSWL